VRRCDVLEEAELAAGSQHAVQLGERQVDVGDRAQHQRGDGGGERRVGERKLLGDRLDHGHGHGCLTGGALGVLTQVGLGLDGDHLTHRPRVVGEVEPVPGADLEHLPAEPLEQLSAPGGEAQPFGLPALADVQPRADRVLDTGHDGHDHNRRSDLSSRMLSRWSSEEPAPASG
jgi:hypothetical protein